MKSKMRTFVIVFIFLSAVVLSIEVAQPAFAEDLWVDVANGNDSNNGLTATTAFRTIQKAATIAEPGTTIHIMAGIYRETITPANDGTATSRVVFIAQNGNGTVKIRGSEPSSSLSWVQLTSNTIGLRSGVDPTKIYYADLSSWNLSAPPRFVVELDNNQEPAARLLMAREPDFRVDTEWKYHEFWWAADGGETIPSCDPETNSNHNCDSSSRSLTQLIDRTSDTEPVGIEPGNLASPGDLVGATIRIMDNNSGHYSYKRTIATHSVSAGTITVDQICEFDSGTNDPALGWGSKYYVEGKPQLLDTPGEWWYDAVTKRLYLWPKTVGNPAMKKIEISMRTNGFKLKNRSYLTLDGLTFEFFNEEAIYHSNAPTDKSYNNIIENCNIRYSNYGISMYQSVAGGTTANIISGTLIENCEIEYIDTHALKLNNWWSGDTPSTFTRAGITNTTIRNNEFHHIGFYSDVSTAIGSLFTHPDKIRLESNYNHHIAHNGMAFNKSTVVSSKTRGFLPSEIKTGEILIKNNIFEKACQLGTDCGALKFWGRTSTNEHVYRDVLIVGNIFRNTYGWTYISEKRKKWEGNLISGRGFYSDWCSGLHLYRNIMYNNGFAGIAAYGCWRDGEYTIYNNVFANNFHGIRANSPDNTYGCVDTQIKNNIFVNNKYSGVSIQTITADLANLSIDCNLYNINGWCDWCTQPGLMMNNYNSSNRYYQTLDVMRQNTSFEDSGVSGNPNLVSYDGSDHNMYDGSWPDFHLTASSTNAIDAGTSLLPASLRALLQKFGIGDSYSGASYDIGAYEYGVGSNGDANCDGLINIQDIVACINHILEVQPLTQQGMTNADMDRNGEINILDITSIVNVILLE